MPIFIFMAVLSAISEEAAKERRRYRKGAFTACTVGNGFTSTTTGFYAGSSIGAGGNSLAGLIGGIGIAIVLFFLLRKLSHFGTMVLPGMAEAARGQAFAVWIVFMLFFGTVSAGTNMMLIATPQAEAEHIKMAVADIVEDSTIAVKGQRKAEAQITAFEGAGDVAKTMLKAEGAGGTICGRGSGQGSCYTALNSLVALAANSRGAIIEAKGTAAPIIRDIEDLQDDLRRISNDEDLTYREKVNRAKTAIENLRLLLEQLSAAMPLEAIDQGIRGFGQEWKSIGISAVGVARFRSAFHPIATQLTTEHREIRAASRREISGLKELNPVELLMSQVAAVWPMLLLAACFDLLVICLTLLGLIGLPKDGDGDHESAPAGAIKPDNLDSADNLYVVGQGTLPGAGRV